jgi:hypothetical protein
LTHTICQNKTDTGLVDSFKFDRVALDWKGRNFQLIGGTQPATKEISDPIPALNRGVYFDGKKKFFAMHPL